MKNKDYFLIIMGDCISQLEYVVSRNGGDTQPFKKLKELVKEEKEEELNRYCIEDF